MGATISSHFEEVVARGSGVQGYHRLCNEFVAILGYIKPCGNK